MDHPQILIAEDSQLTIRLYQRILSEFGYNCHIAENGREAIAKYKLLKNKPEVVIIDYHMPIMDGLTAMSKILKLNPYQSILFASADSDIKNTVMDLGASDFLNKPFEVSELIGIIRKITKKDQSIDINQSEKIRSELI
ncbi:MAG: response regulator [Candidatus Lokiarchaeota archaeon]|nr:response regulator [Candidatus Lokiarchaeota archaeon]